MENFGKEIKNYEKESNENSKTKIILSEIKNLRRQNLELRRKTNELEDCLEETIQKRTKYICKI